MTESALVFLVGVFQGRVTSFRTVLIVWMSGFTSCFWRPQSDTARRALGSLQLFSNEMRWHRAKFTKSKLERHDLAPFFLKAPAHSCRRTVLACPDVMALSYFVPTDLVGPETQLIFERWFGWFGFGWWGRLGRGVYHHPARSEDATRERSDPSSSSALTMGSFT